MEYAISVLQFFLRGIQKTSSELHFILKKNTDKSSLMDQLSFTMGQCRIISRLPIYSGNVSLIIRKKNCVRHRTTVFMKLFEQCPKHYAVLYKNDDCEFQYGFFDYRNCIVKPGGHGKCLSF